MMALVPALYAVPLPSTGRPFIGPKPASDTLRQDMDHIAGMGVDLLVSMLELSEAAALGIGAEARAAASSGLDYRALPVPDMGLPDRQPFTRLVNELALALHSGTDVAVHCRAGVGRSGMMAVAVLMRFGAGLEQAIDRVSDARGIRVPETAAQHAFLASLAPAQSPLASSMAGPKTSSIT